MIAPEETFANVARSFGFWAFADVRLARSIWLRWAGNLPFCFEGARTAAFSFDERELPPEVPDGDCKESGSFLVLMLWFKVWQFESLRNYMCTCPTFLI